MHENSIAKDRLAQQSTRNVTTLHDSTSQNRIKHDKTKHSNILYPQFSIHK